VTCRLVSSSPENLLTATILAAVVWTALIRSADDLHRAGCRSGVSGVGARITG
jgi:hypothetical protein